MDAPKVSVIIPIYNTKLELLDRCIKSVLNQTFGDFELLLIDDGSEKTCAEAMDHYAALDRRIYVYHQANQGVSAARNKGLALAKGEYIVFVDSDDEIMPEFLEVYLNHIEKYDLDMVIGGRREIYPNGKYRSISISMFELECYVMDSPEVLVEKILTEKIADVPELPNDICAPWAKMIKADLAKKVTFPIGVKIFEDIIYNLYLCAYVRKFGFIKENLYHYYVLPASATRQNRPDEMEIHETYLNHIKTYINEIFPQKRNEYYYWVLLRYLWIVRRQDNFDSDTCKSIAEKPFFAEMFRNIEKSKLALRYRHRLILWIAERRFWWLMSLLCGFDRLRCAVKHITRGV